MVISMKNQNKNLAKVMILVVSLIVLGVSTTYAFFTSIIEGTPTETSFTAAKLDVTTNLDNVSEINNLKMQLINAEEKDTKADKVTFEVKSAETSTIDATYQVFLRNIQITKNLCGESGKYFKWELSDGSTTQNGTFENKCEDQVSDNENSEISIDDITLTTSPVTLSKGETDNLIFRMWLENDDNVNQIELTSGTFSGKLYLEAVPVSVNKETSFFSESKL